MFVTFAAAASTLFFAAVLPDAPGPLYAGIGSFEPNEAGQVTSRDQSLLSLTIAVATIQQS